MSTSQSKIFVAKTNDKSSGSKASVAKCGYFKDDFISRLAEPKRRSPLINWVYNVRVQTIDYLVRQFLNLTVGESRVIVNLGAGFDSTFFRLNNNGLLDDCHFIEIDLPDVCGRKKTLISSDSKLFSEVDKCHTNCQSHLDLEEFFIHACQRYSLIGCDICDVNHLQRLLTLIDVNFTRPILFLSEVVLTYINPESVNSIITWTAKTFSNAVFIQYEQVNPFDAFGRHMCNVFKSINAPLLNIEQYYSIDEQKQRFLSREWDCCQVSTAGQFFGQLTSDDELKRLLAVEPFDEFEEFDIVNQHYSFAIAINDSLGKLSSMLSFKCTSDTSICPITDNTHTMSSSEQECQAFAYSTFPSHIQRFSHTVCVTSNLPKPMVFICGGQNMSGRCKSGFFACLQCLKTILSVDLPDSRMRHTACSLGSDIFIFGGRLSPSSPLNSVLKLSFSNDSLNCNCNTTAVCHADRECTVMEAECYCEIPQPRWRHSAVLLTGYSCLSETGDDKECTSATQASRMVIFGGKNSNHAFNDCYELNLQTLVWTKVNATGVNPCARHSHSACIWKDKIVLSGGVDENVKPLNDVFTLEYTSPSTATPLSNDWTWSEIIPSAKMVFTARYGHSSHMYGDLLIMVGGVSQQTNAEIQCIDLTTFQRFEHKLFTPISAPIFMFHNHTSCCFGDKIHIFGGGGNCFSFGTHINSYCLCIELKQILRN